MRPSGKARPLSALRVEIGRVQPSFKCRFARGPFMVQHGEPCRVAAMAFHDHVLAKDPLEGEAEPLGRPAAGRVQRVALPFVAAVAAVFKDVPRHEVHGFRGGGGALQDR